MIKATAQEFVEGVNSVASLPSIYYRVSEVINHPRSSAKDIANIVAEDPGLTARVLKLVNSAFFGFANKVDTVSQSVAIVGTQQLCDLCLATSIIQAFKDIPEDIVNMESFWRHSLACGVCCRILARYHGAQNVERFFVAGMLHDIGSLILYSRMQKKEKEILDECSRNNILLHRMEFKVYGFDHAQVGEALIKQWNLPENLQEAVGNHHRPKLALHHPTEAAVVHLADIIVNALQLGNSGEQLIPNLDDDAYIRVNVPLKQMGKIVDEIEHQFEDVVRVMLKDL